MLHQNDFIYDQRFDITYKITEHFDSEMYKYRLFDVITGKYWLGCSSLAELIVLINNDDQLMVIPFTVDYEQDLLETAIQTQLKKWYSVSFNKGLTKYFTIHNNDICLTIESNSTSIWYTAQGSMAELSSFRTTQLREIFNYLVSLTVQVEKY
jgi:hypothetical protein